MNNLSIYFISLVSFLVLDGLWLGLIAKDFYAKRLGYLMSGNVNWLAAIIFYAIFIAGLVYFVIYPGLKNQSLAGLLMSAAFFGIVCYATYDLTNHAIVKDWPLSITIVDLLWGAAVSTLTTYIVYLISGKI